MSRLIEKIRRRTEEEKAFWNLAFQEKWHSHSPPTRFVIVCNIRTGSTMLQNLLNSHPNARCFFELFHRHKESISFGVKGYQRRSNNPTLVRKRNTDPVGFLEHQIFCRQPKKIVAVGFKLLYSQCRRGYQWWEAPEYAYWWENVGIEPKWELGNRYLWDYLAEEKVRIIHLIRENYLESKVSAIIAQQTGKWGIGATGGNRETTYKHKIIIPFDELLLDLQGEERFREEVRKRFANNPMLETSYEKINLSPQKELSHILNFLNLSEITLTTPTKKMANYHISDIVENYYELKERFKDSSFEYIFKP